MWTSTATGAFDPIGGTSDACKTVTAETDPGTAVYTMMSPGSTLMGLPTVTGSARCKCV